MVNEEDIDRAIKIGQLVELCAKMGGAKAFDPIVKMANQALHEFKVDMGDPEALAEEERRQGKEEDVEVAESDDNPTPAARDDDGIDNDEDGVVDEPDETTTEIDHDDPSLRRP